MTTFDDRNKAFENKFAHDKEIDFKVQARTTKLLARWAAAKMGMAEIDAKTYAIKMVEADLEIPGTEDVVQFLISDFTKAGITVAEYEIRNEMEKQFLVARQQLLDGE